MPGHPPSDTELCEACRQQIPAERYALHVRGLDGGRPECPRQDLVEIALRARGEWDAMRQRYARPWFEPVRW